MYRENDDQIGYSNLPAKIINASADRDHPGGRFDLLEAPTLTAPPVYRRSIRKLPLIATAAAVIAVGGGGWYGTQWWTTGRFHRLDRRCLCARP